MDKDFQQRLRHQHHQSRLQNSLSHTTTSHYKPNSYPTIFPRTNIIDRQVNSRPSRQSSGGTGFTRRSSQLPRFLQLNVCDPKEKWWYPSGIQLKKPQPVLRCASLQDGNHQRSLQHDQSKRLLDVDRSIRCLSTYSSSYRLQTLPSVQVEISSLPILYNSLRFELSPLRLFQNLPSYFELGTFTRDQAFGLPRRLDSSSSNKTTSSSTISTSSKSIKTIGMEDQLGQIDFNTITQHRTSGISTEHYNYDSFITNSQIEGFKAIDQASITTTYQADAKKDSQFSYEDPGSNLCDIPSTIVHTSPIILQESNGQVNSGLGQGLTIGSAKYRGTEMVVRQPQQMEWQIDPTYDTISNGLCGCKQHGMGMPLEKSTRPWLLDSRRKLTINQLERAESCSSCPSILPDSEEYHDPDTYRQHNQLIIYQQTRWNQVSPITESSDRGMELVLSQQYNHTSTACTRCREYNCRCRIKTNLLQEPMADPTTSIQAVESTLGPSFSGSIRRSHDEITTKVRLLAQGSSRYPHGCLFMPMDNLGELIHKPTLEFNFSSPQQINQRRNSSGDYGGSVLAKCDLVSLDHQDGNSTPSLPTSTRYSDNFTNDQTPSTEQLDALRVAIIRDKLVKQDLNEQALKDMLLQKLAPTATNKGYRKSQLRFLAWASKHNVSCTSFSGADLINFLATLKHDFNLQSTTLKSIRAAVTHLHDDPKTIQDHPLVNNYLISVACQAPPISIHRNKVDLTPSIDYARSIPSKPSTAFGALQQKLSFLLAMVAFLRPSDLARIPYSSCTVRPMDGCLLFQVVSPKETRKRRKIIKPYTIHPHATDPELCPVVCFLALRNHPQVPSRPIDSLLFVKPSLLRTCSPIASSTISSWLHRNFISLSTSESRVSIRSLASSQAFDSGVDLQDITSLGNWASSTTFTNHYQRNHMAKIDFTSKLLTSSVIPEEDQDNNVSLD